MWPASPGCLWPPTKILLCGGYFPSPVGVLESLWATAGGWHPLSQARSVLLWPVTAGSSSDFPIQQGVGGARSPGSASPHGGGLNAICSEPTLRLFRHLSSLVPDPFMCLVLSRHVCVRYPGTGLGGQQGRAAPHFTDGIFEACLGHGAKKLRVPNTVLIPVI